MAKLHHKLQYLTDYVNKDLQLANSKTGDSHKAIDLATATLGVALDDMDKAVQLRPVVASSQHTYQNQQHPYNLKLAILVSRHKVIDGTDYGRIHARIGQLASDQSAAKQKLPLPRRKKFLGIF